MVSSTIDETAVKGAVFALNKAIDSIKLLPQTAELGELDKEILDNPSMRKVYCEICELVENDLLHPKSEALLGLLETEVRERGNLCLVNVDRKATIFGLVDLLREKGYRVGFLTGGTETIEQLNRTITLQKLAKGETDVILATSMMGELGVDFDTLIEYSLTANGRGVQRRFTLVLDHPDSRDLYRYLRA